MFGAPGGAIASEMAMETFEDDMKYAGRQVRFPLFLLKLRNNLRRISDLAVSDTESPRDGQREPLHPLLSAFTPRTTRPPRSKQCLGQLPLTPIGATGITIPKSEMAVCHGGGRGSATTRVCGGPPEQKAGGAGADRSGRVHGEQLRVPCEIAYQRDEACFR